MSAPVLELLSRPGCHLCDATLGLLRPAAERAGVAVVVRDIEEDDRLVRDFGERIPVLRTGDGRILAEGVVGSAEVEAALDVVAPRRRSTRGGFRRRAGGA